MRKNARNDQRIKVNDEQVDDVEELLYLGALLDKEGGVVYWELAYIRGTGGGRCC